MLWFKWGEQGNIFGIPLALAYLIGGFYNFFENARRLQSIIRGQPYLWMSDSVFFRSMGWDLTRIIASASSAIGVLWGATNLAIYSFACDAYLVKRQLRFFIYPAYIIKTAEYLYVFLVYLLFPQNVAETHLAFRATMLGGVRYPFPWPIRFWVIFIANILITIMMAIIAIDLSMSFANVLAVNGTGWESKNAKKVAKDIEKNVERQPVQQQNRTLAERAALLADMV